MTNLPSATLAQIVTDDHRAATVLEKYHLDYCCKGKRSLQQACKESNLNMEEVLAELNNSLQTGTAPSTSISHLSPTQLAIHIITHHHEYVKNEMPAIETYLEKIAAKHGGRHPEMVQVLEQFRAVKEELDMHMQKEEAVLFPRIEEIESLHAKGQPLHVHINYLISPINMMEQEHDHAGVAMATIRTLTSNYTLPEDACTTYQLSFAALQAFEQDLHQHVHLENNVLFPKALALFQNKRPGQLN